MQKTDILVVGGGIAGIGLANAVCANRQHRKRVVVLERESQPGYHSTGRSAATWIQSYGNACIRELNERSKGFFDKSTGFEGGPLLSPRGLLLCSDGSDQQELETNELLAATTAVVEIDAARALDLVPVLNSDRYKRYVYEAGTCDIDVGRLLQGWISQFKQAGGSLFCDSEILSIDKKADHWQVVTASGEWHTDIVVNAAGAWADTLANLAGVKSPGLKPLRRSAAIIELGSSKDVRQWPLFAEIDESWYAKPESGHLMVSPADEDPVDACDAWVDDEVLAAGIDRFEQGISESVNRVHHQWAGLRTFSTDQTPVVGFDSSVDNFFWLAGHGGYGIQTAPAMSGFAADLLLGNPVDLGLLNSLTPGRFPVKS